MMLCPIYLDGIRFMGRVRNLKADTWHHHVMKTSAVLVEESELFNTRTWTGRQQLESKPV